MIKIYCIEDINDLKYVGATKQKLENRLLGHIHKRNCSSIKLNLENSIIYLLEECEKKDKFEREKYWINKIDCVNTKKLNFYGNEKEYNKEYNKKYYLKNKENFKKRNKEYYEKNLKKN